MTAVRLTIDFHVRPGEHQAREVRDAIEGALAAVGRALSSTPFPPAVMTHVELVGTGAGRQPALVERPEVVSPERLSK